MFNVRPYVPGFNVKPPDEPEVPGFRMKVDGTVRTDDAAFGQPPDIRPDNDVPGFRINSTEGVPGFRVPRDWSPRPTFVTGGLPSQGYINVNSPYPYPVDTSAYPDASIMEKIRDPDWVVPRLGAAADGAISTIPGAWNFMRAIGRAAGIGGKEEAHRFDDEMKMAGKLAGKVVGKAVEYPEQATRAVGEVVSELDKDPLFRYYMAGRILAGYFAGVGPVRLGPFAMMGDAFRAIEKGYGIRDTARQVIEGNPWLRGLSR